MAKRYFTTDKTGDTVEVDQELARQLVAQGKKTHADFEIEDDGQPAAPAPATTAPPKEVGSLEAIAPSFLSASQGGQGYAGRTWGAAKDLLSLPLRTVAGAGSAIGTALGGGSADESGRAFMGGMSSPVESAQEAYGSTPAVQKLLANPLMYAGMAQDPKTVPLAALGGTGMGPIAQGLIGSTAAYGQRRVDEAVSGSSTGYSPTKSELLPLALGIGVGALPGSGRALQNAGNSMFRKMVKPVTKEVEGLQDALAAGKLPQLAGWSGSVGGAGEQFLKSLELQGAQYPKILAAADATGNKVSTFHASQASKNALAKAMEDRQLSVSIPEGRAALDWIRGRVQIPSTKQGIAQALEGRSVPANDILPSQAHPIKSSLYDAAFDPASTSLAPKAARVMAAKGAARDLRSQLGEISPEYAALNREMAPLYGAEDAMSRAAAVRGNNFHLTGLDILGAGIPVALRTPALARGLFELGGASQSAAPFAKILTPLAAAPGEQRKLEKK